ncbi:MAG: elongation factor G, partial [Elusimicrobiota bacterium]
ELAVYVACGVDGLGVGAELIWNRIREYKLPAFVFINRIDKERADFSRTIDLLRDKFGRNLAPIQVPIGKESQFSGIIDIVRMKAFAFEDGKQKEIPVPGDADISSYREMLIESLSDVDESLLSKYLDGKDISQEELVSALKNGVSRSSVVPVLCGSAQKNIAVTTLCNAIMDYAPAPNFIEHEGTDTNGNKVAVKSEKDGTFSGFIFKTTVEPHVGELAFLKIYSGKIANATSVDNPVKRQSERIGQINVLQGKNRTEISQAYAGDIVVLPKLKSTETGDTLCDENKEIIYPKIVFPEPIYHLAVKPKSKEDQDKIGMAFNSFRREDPAFRTFYNPETKETIISGMGDVHLDVILERFRRQYGVEVEVTAPRVPYKETIRGKAQAQGKYKRQTGGRGQYGDCWLLLEPLAEGKGFEFVDKIVGGAIPKNYIPAVEKGVKGAMEEGVIAGYPVVDLRVTVYDGTYHEVDSSDMAFKIAGSLGFKKAFQDAKPTILEPIMILEVSALKDYVGDIMGDINKRRGRIISFEEDKIISQIPLSEISRYAIDLRSITRGHGYFSTKFSHYEEAPAQVQQELIAKYQQEKTKEKVEQA